MRFERKIYCPPVMCIEALRVNGPSEKNAYAMKSVPKTVFRNYEERQCASKALPPNTDKRKTNSNTKAVYKMTSLHGEHSHNQREKPRRPSRSSYDLFSETSVLCYENVNLRGKRQVCSQVMQERPYQLPGGRSCGFAYLSLHHFRPPREDFGPWLPQNLSY